MDPAHVWHPSPRKLSLSRDEVHVWRLHLSLPQAQVQRLRQTLAAGELARVLRFRFQRDRDRFIVARGLLRSILGQYLAIEPGQVQFCYGRQGKPHLPGPHGPQTLCFNLAHSADLALLAVARGREVGVDVERLWPDFDWEPVAESFFSPREVATLRALPREQQLAAFYACWTRKEAYLKARGDGLASTSARAGVRAGSPLGDCEVSLIPAQPAELLRVGGDPAESSRWTLAQLSPASGYIGAIAVAGTGWQLRCWQWNPGQPNAERLETGIAQG